MTIMQVIDDIKNRFIVGITFSIADHGRMMALENVEEDAKKQFTDLCSYSEELRRVCKFNHAQV